MSIDDLLHTKNRSGRFPDPRKLKPSDPRYDEFYSLVENWDGIKRYYDKASLAEIKATYHGRENRELGYEWLDDLMRHNELMGGTYEFEEGESLGIIVQHIHDHFIACIKEIAQTFKGANMLHAFSAVYASMIFARHCYIEGSSGTGKTALVRSLCQFLELPYQQFDAAADVTDILLVGGEVPRSDPDRGMDFVFQRGPLINPGALTLVIDELPRLPAATSNVLLQAMAERKVTISLVASGRGSTTVLLSPGFAVIGMGNPVGYGGQGERSLALYDRFDIGIDMEHPDADARIEIYDLATTAELSNGKTASPQMNFTLRKATAALPQIVFPKPLKHLLALASYLASPSSFRERVAWEEPLPSSDAIGKAINPLFRPGKSRRLKDFEWGRQLDKLCSKVDENLVEGSNPRGEISAALNAQAHAAMHGRQKVSLADLRVGFAWANFARLKTYPGCEAERGPILNAVADLCFNPKTLKSLRDDLVKQESKDEEVALLFEWFKGVEENKGEAPRYENLVNDVHS